MSPSRMAEGTADNTAGKWLSTHISHPAPVHLKFEAVPLEEFMYHAFRLLTFQVRFEAVPLVEFMYYVFRLLTFQVRFVV